MKESKKQKTLLSLLKKISSKINASKNTQLVSVISQAPFKQSTMKLVPINLEVDNNA